MKKILILTTTEGHESIANAVQEIFAEKKVFTTQKILIEEPGLKYYEWLYKRSPHLFKPFYRLSFLPIVNFSIKKILFKNHFDRLNEIIKNDPPDIVINTSFGFSPALEKLKKMYNFTFINIVPNPRTFFPQDIAQTADANIVFDDEITKMAKKMNPTATITPLGWFVQQRYEPANKQDVRNELKIELNSLCFLFTSGSQGTESVFQLVKNISVQLQTQPVTLIVACGRNAKLFSAIQSIQHTPNVTIIPLAFTKELHKYMQASDLVIGKAGPNTIFEATATHTLFFVTTHVGGLEDGNVEIVKEYRLGFVEEDLERATQKLLIIIEHPTVLTHNSGVETMASYNRQAKSKLIDLVENKLTRT